MFKRAAQTVILQCLEDHPGVLLTGARQCGKTTLAQTLGGRYYDMEKDSDRLRLDIEWDTACNGTKLTILDEAQAWPQVFPRLRGAIDQDRTRKGRFLLLGSVAPLLMREVSESLAGRLAIVQLGPLTLKESPDTPLDDFWLRGGFPETLMTPRLYPRWQTDYLGLLAQRDLPEWGLTSKPSQTQRLFKMLAAMHGQALNASQLGKSLALSHNTVRNYVDFLAGAFLVRELPSYSANLKKRLIKSPKVYWGDSGLLHALLGVKDHMHLLEQPWVGASWEGFVIQQILDTLNANGVHAEASHLRTSDGWEVDLVLEFAAKVWAVEVKLSSNPSSGDLQRLNKAASLIKAHRRVLISRTPEIVENKDTLSCNLERFLERL